MSELEKPFLKNSDRKNLNKINVKMPYVNKKPPARNGNLVKTKKVPRMSSEWIGKHFENPLQKIEKTEKIEMKLPHVNKKH